MTFEEWNKLRQDAAKDPAAAFVAISGRSFDGLPVGLREGWARWWLFGIWPGSFLSAVIRNDLTGSFAKADEENRHSMFSIVSWTWNNADPRCTKGHADAWSKAEGYLGLLKREVKENG